MSKRLYSTTGCIVCLSVCIESKAGISSKIFGLKLHHGLIKCRNLTKISMATRKNLWDRKRDLSEKVKYLEMSVIVGNSIKINKKGQHTLLFFYIFRIVLLSNSRTACDLFRGFFICLFLHIRYSEQESTTVTRSDYIY